MPETLNKVTHSVRKQHPCSSVETQSFVPEIPVLVSTHISCFGFRKQKGEVNVQFMSCQTLMVITVEGLW